MPSRRRSDAAVTCLLAHFRGHKLQSGLLISASSAWSIWKPPCLGLGTMLIAGTSLCSLLPTYVAFAARSASWGSVIRSVAGWIFLGVGRGRLIAGTGGQCTRFRVHGPIDET